MCTSTTGLCLLFVFCESCTSNSKRTVLHQPDCSAPRSDGNLTIMAHGPFLRGTLGDFAAAQKVVYFQTPIHVHGACSCSEGAQLGPQKRRTKGGHPCSVFCDRVNGTWIVRLCDLMFLLFHVSDMSPRSRVSRCLRYDFTLVKRRRLLLRTVCSTLWQYARLSSCGRRLSVFCYWRS